MIQIGFVHTFVLVGPDGGRVVLASADLDQHEAGPVIAQVATSIASRLSDPEEHQAALTGAERALTRLEETPGTPAMAGVRLSGDRLLRVYRHLAGDHLVL